MTSCLFASDFKELQVTVNKMKHGIDSWTAGNSPDLCRNPSLLGWDVKREAGKKENERAKKKHKNCYS